MKQRGSGERYDLKPRMVLQQQRETLTYHAGRADDTNFVLLHVYQILPERCNNGYTHRKNASCAEQTCRVSAGKSASCDEI